jgi:hypothetical protein
VAMRVRWRIVRIRGGALSRSMQHKPEMYSPECQSLT